MSEPIVTINNVDTTKISHKSGKNSASISFSFDQDIVDYRVNINGVSWDTGMVAGSGNGSVYMSGTEIIEIIDDLEVGAEATDGTYRINIYGKSTDGIWSSYNQTGSAKPPYSNNLALTFVDN